MRNQTNRPAWVVDDFHAGQQLGRLNIMLDDERLAKWAAVYGAPSDVGRVPSGVLVAAMMEAYLKAFQLHPPGNIHASQKLTFGKPARAGDRLEADVSCLWKERRKERGWIGFGATLRRDGKDILSGETWTIRAK